MDILLPKYQRGLDASLQIKMGNPNLRSQAFPLFNLLKISASDKFPAERRQPTKKERSLLRRRQRDREHLQRVRRKQLKKILLIAIGVLVVGGGIFGGSWLLANKPSQPESEIISRQGIHWHSELSINILGQEQSIPANIGHSGVEKPIHTHDADNIIHLEFTGLVRKDDILLGRFFENWGKKFNRDCILAQCNGAVGEVKMFVNEEPNLEFENYAMNDNDRIEIIFE